MPEDEGERGRVANERLDALLTELGWTKRGKSNVDVPCTSGVHANRTKGHGVDSYFTYDSPFHNLERGVFVESKIRKWENINRDDLRDSMTQTLQTVECVPESDKFEEHLNGYEQRNYNAGVVGIWSSDNFHEADFQGYVSDVGIHRKERGTYEIAVLGNRELNKLARLAKEYNRLKNDYNNDSDEVYFYYPSMADKPFPDKQDSLALEALLSDLIFVQIKRASGYDRENTPTGFERVNVIFYFGDFTLDSLEVVFKALVEYNLLDVEEVLIYYDNEHLDRGIQDIESAKAQFANTIIPDNGEIVEDKEIPKFDFDTLPSVTYDNYTEGLRGDDNA